MPEQFFVETEITTQPDCWRRAASLNPDSLPARGERVAVVGCGTSWFVAQSYAALRESAGQGETDAFAASEFPLGRAYDRVVAITRSGTTTEVLDLLDQVRGRIPTVAVIGDPDTPVVRRADQLVVLDFADERSVVQTRFATTTLALLRASLGEDLGPAVRDAERAVVEPLPAELVGAEQYSFLGRGWTCGLAQEAGLKMREAAGAWTESYPAMEYRHGPISITGPGRVAWMFGTAPQGLAEQVAATGGLFRTSDLDPMADLITVQRVAVAIAVRRGLDPDQPRHLSRSVILDDGQV
ncbi:SIS domain-containing protein [Kutzneria viridogrisea]|uniref:Fructoselysine-6-P-deglycase FrlB-like protein n=1 Tax=Kutzneria viridogrisea TaxID=47990 RepID=A0ABR6BRQ6_9PSEU|nr:SIS domain-containing protein [Kutzneria albida]MBA8929605.1 fructoselysine-6-P-deglycase FrlB-like protein [Kutzneria viridogrisea]